MMGALLGLLAGKSSAMNTLDERPQDTEDDPE
jgi:hypothetical protein